MRCEASLTAGTRPDSCPTLRFHSKHHLDHAAGPLTRRNHSGHGRCREVMPLLQPGHALCARLRKQGVAIRSHLHPGCFITCELLLYPLQAGPAGVLQAGVRGAGRHHHLCNSCEQQMQD